jgi:hypothetical protein
MTKVRKPLTPYRALTEVIDVLGFDGCTEVTGKKEWQLRKMSDADTGRDISFRDAMRLDVAYRRAGGDGAPFLECFAARLEVELADEADRPDQLLRLTGNVSKEVGEAIAAAIELAGRRDDPAAYLRAVDEARQGLATVQSLVSSLERGNIHERCQS